MYQRIITFGAAAAVVVVTLALPTSPPTHSTEDVDAGIESTDVRSAPLTGSGHPEALAVLGNGDTIAISDGGWITRRPSGTTAWEPARAELPVSSQATVNARGVISSGNTLLTVFHQFSGSVAFAWRPNHGWAGPVPATGPLWNAPRGVVGVGLERFGPAHGWEALPTPPLKPIQMGADADGRISAVGVIAGELRIARYSPLEGWDPSIRVTDLEPGDTLDLSVSRRGDGAITVGRAHRLVLFRRLEDADWRRYVVTDSEVPNHRVHIDDQGRATVVWQDDDSGLTASRLDTDDGWTLPQEIAEPTSPDDQGFVLRGTADGRLAIAYRRAADAGWTTFVRVRTPEDLWSEPYEASPVGDEYGLGISPTGCATAYAWADPLGTFDATALGPCDDPDPRPTDTETAWSPLSTPYGALTYAGDRIHVARTDDGHTLLGWTGLQARQARASEDLLTGYTASERLGPPGETCHLRRLDAIGSAVQAILDCGYRRWYTRTWTAASGWTPPLRMPSGDGEVDVYVNHAGGTVVVFAFDDEPRTQRVLYRPTPDDEWQTLPEPPAFTDPVGQWTVGLSDDGNVVLVDGDGSEYATYEPATNTWSPVQRAPVAATTWLIADDGTLLAWQKPDLFAVGNIEGQWTDPQSFDATGRHDVALVPDHVVLVEVDEATGDLLTRDFDVASQIWSEPTVLYADGTGPYEPKLTVDAAGDAVVTWAQADRFGLTEPDLVWHRAAGSSSWRGPDQVPDGYHIDAAALPDGALFATTDDQVDVPGVWLSQRAPN
jgi:hypothetical protein